MDSCDCPSQIEKCPMAETLLIRPWVTFLPMFCPILLASYHLLGIWMAQRQPFQCHLLHIISITCAIGCEMPVVAVRTSNEL